MRLSFLYVKDNKTENNILSGKHKCRREMKNNLGTENYTIEPKNLSSKRKELK